MNADELKVVLTYLENVYKQNDFSFSPAMLDLWLEELRLIPFEVVNGAARHWVEYRHDEAPVLFDLLAIIEDGWPNRYPIDRRALGSTNTATWLRRRLYKGWDYDNDTYDEECQEL
jgi:hypothetical protein